MICVWEQLPVTPPQDRGVTINRGVTNRKEEIS
jgi:hypothetical protein